MQYLLPIIIATSLLFSCGRDERGTQNQSELEQLGQTYELYRELAQDQQNGLGFIYTDKCDSLLFSALLGVVTRPITITAARNVNGQWFRRPSQDCFSSGQSRSTISRDMLLGVLIYAYYYDRGDIVEDLWNYGEARSWIMGDADSFDTRIGRTVMSPGFIRTLAELDFQMNGNDHIERHILPISYNTDPGFTSHLTMLLILLNSKLQGDTITRLQLNALNKIKEHSPRNALSQALYARFNDGNQAAAIHLLVTLWPQDRLPTSADWCEEWITQRQDVSAPCAEHNHVYSGGDFLFAAAIVLGLL